MPDPDSSAAYATGSAAPQTDPIPACRDCWHRAEIQLMGAVALPTHKAVWSLYNRLHAEHERARP